MLLKDIVLTERIAANLSQKELADKSGTTQQTIARCESGQSEPKFYTAVKILQALNFDFSVLNKPVQKSLEKAIRLNNFLYPDFKVELKSKNILDYSDVNDVGEPIETTYKIHLYLFTALHDIIIRNLTIPKDYKIEMYEQEIDDFIEDLNNIVKESQSNIFLESAKIQIYFELMSTLSINEGLNSRYKKAKYSPEELESIIKGRKKIIATDILNNSDVYYDFDDEIHESTLNKH